MDLSIETEMTTMTTQARTVMVVVTADQDQDDCLAAAAESYIATHPALAGWDLSPTWADASREQVTLTVPAWAVRA